MPGLSTELEDVTIFTNGLSIALELEAEIPRFTVVVTGGTLLVPVFGNAIAAEELLNPMAVQFKKSLADAAMNAATVQGLTARGHQLDVIIDSYQDFGAGQFIWRMGDPGVEGYMAASDPRRDGLAAGY